MEWFQKQCRTARFCKGCAHIVVENILNMAQIHPYYGHRIHKWVRAVQVSTSNRGAGEISRRTIQILYLTPEIYEMRNRCLVVSLCERLNLLHVHKMEGNSSNW